MNRSLSHRPSFPPSPTRTPPSYASRCILECPFFLFFLAFALMNFRVFSPPQRKQVIGRFSFRLRQDLQYALPPCLFSPHPSVLQFLDSFSALKHSEQASLRVDRETLHPQIAASKTYSFSTLAVAHDWQCVLGNIPLHTGGPGQPMWMRQKYRIPRTKGGPSSLGGGLRETGSRWRAGPVRCALRPATSHRPPWAMD